MTELERLLQESLAQTEHLLRNTQSNHSQTLQQHNRELANLKSAMQTLQAEQATLTAHLMRLSTVYEGLQPLLIKLNALLSGK